MKEKAKVYMTLDNEATIESYTTVYVLDDAHEKLLLRKLDVLQLRIVPLNPNGAPAEVLLNDAKVMNCISQLKKTQHQLKVLSLEDRPDPKQMKARKH